jgi:hypothetical protein
MDWYRVKVGEKGVLVYGHLEDERGPFSSQFRTSYPRDEDIIRDLMQECGIGFDDFELLRGAFSPLFPP